MRLNLRREAKRIRKTARELGVVVEVGEADVLASVSGKVIEARFMLHGDTPRLPKRDNAQFWPANAEAAGGPCR